MTLFLPALVAVIAAYTLADPRSPGPFPDALAGRWSTRAVHLHRDGRRLEDAGMIACEWILERTYLRCDRLHRQPDGLERRSMQLYSRRPDGGLEVLTFYAGRTMRVTQRGTIGSDGAAALAGTVPLPGNRTLETRGRFSHLSPDSLRYENESEEAPGEWRIDYVEIYTRIGR